MVMLVKAVQSWNVPSRAASVFGRVTLDNLVHPENVPLKLVTPSGIMIVVKLVQFVNVLSRWVILPDKSILRREVQLSKA